VVVSSLTVSPGNAGSRGNNRPMHAKAIGTTRTTVAGRDSDGTVGIIVAFCRALLDVAGYGSGLDW